MKDLYEQAQARSNNACCKVSMGARDHSDLFRTEKEGLTILKRIRRPFGQPQGTASNTPSCSASLKDVIVAVWKHSIFR